VPLTAVRTWPVSVWVSFTCAPGTAAPVESCTVPEICEVETAWPHAAAAMTKRHRTARIDLTLIAPPSANVGELPCARPRDGGAHLMLEAIWFKRCYPGFVRQTMK